MMRADRLVLAMGVGCVAGVWPVAAQAALSQREVAECATRLSDGLRAWPVVAQSADGIDVVLPLLVVEPGVEAEGLESAVSDLIAAMHVRLGAKVRFVRRDENGPGFLPVSKRFDYESRLVAVPSAGQRGATGFDLVLELFDPAGASPVLRIQHEFSGIEQPAERKGVSDDSAGAPEDRSYAKGKESGAVANPEDGRDQQSSPSQRESDQKRRREDLRKQEKARRRIEEEERKKAEAEVKRGQEAAREEQKREEKRRGEEKKSPQRVLPFELGHIYFKDKKTAERLAVLTEGSQRLADGRLEVQVSVVCRKDDREIKIRTLFYSAAGERVETSPEMRYELQEGRPHTIRVQSRNAAARFVLEIDKD